MGTETQIAKIVIQIFVSVNLDSWNPRSHFAHALKIVSFVGFMHCSLMQILETLKKILKIPLGLITVVTANIKLTRLSLQDIEIQKQLKKHFQFRDKDCAHGLFLVQAVEDFSYLNRLVFFLMHIKYRQLHMNWVLIPFRIKKSSIKFYLAVVSEQFCKRVYWKKIYSSFQCRFIFGPSVSQFKGFQSKTPQVLLNSVKSKKDLECLMHNGVLIGDLIYDTYLRFAHQPTLNLDDPFLLEIFEWTIFIFEQYEALFARNKYSGYITSYTSYIHHGIPARIALKNDVPLIALGSSRKLALQLNKEFSYHMLNFKNYRSWFLKLPQNEQQRGIELGHLGIRKRLSGDIDSATWYMKQSAYSKGSDSLQLPPKERTTILLICHDFFDSPHIYGTMLFPDFYVWMDETLSFLTENTDSEILIKPHPNGVGGNEEILSEFLKKYPNILILPKESSNIQLVNRGVDLALTVYGTVAHELPYLGVRVLCCSENPHLEFSFCKTTLDKKSYFDYLKDPLLIPVPEAKSDEIAEFYFSHNYFTLDQSLNLFPFIFNKDQMAHSLNEQHAEFNERKDAMKKATAGLFFNL